MTDETRRDQGAGAVPTSTPAINEAMGTTDIVTPVLGDEIIPGAESQTGQSPDGEWDPAGMGEAFDPPTATGPQRDADAH